MRCVVRHVLVSSSLVFVGASGGPKPLCGPSCGDSYAQTLCLIAAGSRMERSSSTICARLSGIGSDLRLGVREEGKQSHAYRADVC